MGHSVLQKRGGGVLPGVPRTDVYGRTGTAGRDSNGGGLMRGWGVKPIGVLVVLSLLSLFSYIAYRLIHLDHSNDAGPPDK